MIISGHADSQRSSPGTHGPPNGAPPHLQLSPANSGGLSRYSTAQVVALREALRREQEEVARLRREVSLMKAQDHHRRTPSAGCSGDRDGPVTPEAPAEQHAREAIMSIPSDGDISTPCMSTSGAPWVQRAAFF